jgi:hypothetical protein
LTDHPSNTGKPLRGVPHSPTDPFTGQEIEPDRWWLLSRVDTAAVRSRYRAIWRTSAVNTADLGSPAGALVEVIRDVPALCVEVDRLCLLLSQARNAYANLTAAARAALAAHAESEADPWWYLRDELGAQLYIPQRRPAPPPDRGAADA